MRSGARSGESVRAGQAGAAGQATMGEQGPGQTQLFEMEKGEIQHRSSPDTASTSEESSCIANADELEHHDAEPQRTLLSRTRLFQVKPPGEAELLSGIEVADCVVSSNEVQLKAVPQGEEEELEERDIEVMANGHARQTTRESLVEIPDEP